LPVFLHAPLTVCFSEYNEFSVLEKQAGAESLHGSLGQLQFVFVPHTALEVGLATFDRVIEFVAMFLGCLHRTKRIRRVEQRVKLLDSSREFRVTRIKITWPDTH
jgi:hypothetical protein